MVLLSPTITGSCYRFSLTPCLIIGGTVHLYYLLIGLELEQHPWFRLICMSNTSPYHHMEFSSFSA